MAFDWFRRKFSGGQSSGEQPSSEQPLGEQSAEQAEIGQQDAGPPTPEASEPEPPPVVASDDNPTTDAEAAPEADDESLAWAKAAFANIKRKQAAAPEADSPEADSPASSLPTTVPASEASPAALVAEVPENCEAPESPEAPEAPESPEALDPSEAAQPPEAPEPPPASSSPLDPAESSSLEPNSPAPLSLLARAEAERAERLERLKATAIEEPEPEPEDSEEDEPELDSGPRITFDENFIWSAEVLAAQGRRPEEISYEEITWLNRLRQGLGKTRRGLVNQLKAVVGQGPLNDDAVMEIESLLLQADVGVDATDYIIESLQAKLREEALPPAQAIAYLKRLIRELLDSPIQNDESIVLAPEKDQLNIWLMTGVNGAGKTTTIGKLAHLAKKSDYRCLIAAADTFRAAAVQQVKVWGERSDIEVIANPGQNTDPAAVVFDAIAAAQSRNIELLLVDTAGRLQNKKNLMDELAKVRRIINKKAPDARVESLLVLDATLGQNGLRQAEVFAQAAELSGVVLTKLDGTAKGGVALAVVRQLGLPIRFIGAGEGIGDLRPFSSYEFVEALLSG